MTGKLATLDNFIKGTKSFSKSLLKKKGERATEVVTEATEDPEQEMKTFWFSNDQENQEGTSWLPGLVNIISIYPNRGTLSKNLRSLYVLIFYSSSFRQQMSTEYFTYDTCQNLGQQ